MRLIIFHEYGAPEHFIGLYSFVEKQGLRIRSFEFSFLKLFVKACLKCDVSGMTRVVGSFFKLIALPFQSQSTIVLGMAPWDWRLLLFLLFGFKHQLVLFTSWPDWQGSRQPKRDLFGMTRKLWLWALQRRFSAIASVTPAGQRSLVKLTSAPVHVVFHAIDEQILSAKSRDERLLFVGRLVPEKGVLRAIEIAICAGIPITIVGDGALRSEVVSKAAENPGQIEFRGLVSDREELALMFSSHQVLILPSEKTKQWEEVFGLVIVEAMMHGCIPLSSRHVGPIDILGTELPELLFDEAMSEKAIADQVKGVIANRTTIEAKMAKIAGRYTPDAIAEKWSFIADLSQRIR